VNPNSVNIVEQIKRWKKECLEGFKTSKEQEKLALKQAKTDQRKIKDLEKDLRRKNAALAETTALLVLRKKRGAMTLASERRQIIDLIYQSCADGAPSQIVPTLLDLGVYLASESSFYRVLKRMELQNHLGRIKYQPSALSQSALPPVNHKSLGRNT